MAKHLILSDESDLLRREQLPMLPAIYELMFLR
jgi:hypothetical protein